MKPDEDFRIWEGIYPSFEAAEFAAVGPGFDGEIYQKRAVDAAQECIAAMKAGRPIPPFHKQRSAMLAPIVAMMLEATHRVRILDLGGGLGIGYMTLIESLPQAANRIEYWIVEVSHICATGRDLFGEEIRFSESPPRGGEFDLVHCASALQYFEDWRQVLNDLSAYRAPYLLLSDVFAGNISTFVTLQNYYGSGIKHWFLNFDELMEVIDRTGYQLRMKSYVTARRFRTYDVLPMDNFPASHRLEQSLHLLLRRKS